MSAILSSQVEFNPVTVGGLRIVSNEWKSSRKTHQSKLKGIASGLTLALKTFLNSSNVMVPELSLDILVKPGPGRKQSGEELHVHVEILEGNEVIRVGPLQ